MNRIVIMGPPGSGKSTLARQLGTMLGLPVHHLDQYYWQPGWKAAPAVDFKAAVETLAADERWIIEGNYTATIAPRLARADAVIYLDVTALTSLKRVLLRSWRERGWTRADLPPNCPERIDLTFYWFALNWNRRSRARNLALLAGSDRPVHILRRGEVDGFVHTIAPQIPPALVR